MELVVVSPINIDKEGKWSFLIKENNQSFKAHMDDVSFRSGYLNGRYPMKKTKSDDRMSVLVEYQRREKNGDVEITRTAVHTVYAFNETQIKESSKSDIVKKISAKTAPLPFEILWRAG